MLVSCWTPTVVNQHLNSQHGAQAEGTKRCIQRSPSCLPPTSPHSTPELESRCRYSNLASSALNAGHHDNQQAVGHAIFSSDRNFMHMRSSVLVQALKAYTRIVFVSLLATCNCTAQLSRQVWPLAIQQHQQTSTVAASCWMRHPLASSRTTTKPQQSDDRCSSLLPHPPPSSL